jgi:(E)-4-hydroxy-3-methylbut-2-enyl-diphosphate synthase
MVTSATTDIAASVAQIVRLVEAGCEIVRLAVPTSQDAASLLDIRHELKARRVRVPLVADVHFTPAVAIKVAEHVEKVRINPGNFADKKRFAQREYTDSEYEAEIERIRRLFVPLVRRCRELGVAMRIGTNHGSLSDRILNRHGDTPMGMVESALEFVRIAEAEEYRDLVLSMKASNPLVVLEAYRLLAARMDLEGMDYPLHLGVTEAGDGEDARVKSAVGIGVLLEEGLGDTVRVSLTEDPVAEIPVARALVAPFNGRPVGAAVVSPAMSPRASLPEARTGGRRATRAVALGPRFVGGARPVLVEVPLVSSLRDEEALIEEAEEEVGREIPEGARAEIVSTTLAGRDDAEGLARLAGWLTRDHGEVALSARLDPRLRPAEAQELLDAVLAHAHRVHLALEAPLSDEGRSLLEGLLEKARRSGTAILLEAGASSGRPEDAVALAVHAARRAEDSSAPLLLALHPAPGSPLLPVRLLAARLEDESIRAPIVLLDRPGARGAEPLLGPASALGGLLSEGIGDTIHIGTNDRGASRRLALGILQATRVRITRTEFISCPSCGRTLFDLEATTARIKARTAHLKGVKIAIMGCIVNGPGEMADADFGYVGWGERRIALFVGRELVEKDIPAEEAAERLVELIRRSGRWVDP